MALDKQEDMSFDDFAIRLLGSMGRVSYQEPESGVRPSGYTESVPDASARIMGMYGKKSAKEQRDDAEATGVPWTPPTPAADQQDQYFADKLAAAEKGKKEAYWADQDRVTETVRQTAAIHYNNIKAINKEIANAKTDKQRKILQEELAKEQALATDIEGQISNAPEQAGYNITNNNLTPGAVREATSSPFTSDPVKRSAVAAAARSQGFTDAITKIVEDAGPRKQRNLDELADLESKKLDLLGEVTRLQKTKGQLAADAAAAAHAHDANQAADRANLMAAAGIRTDIADSKVNTIVANNARLTEQMYTLGDEIDAAKSVTFLDDPATWFANQFNLPPKIAAYNALTAKVNRGTEIIKNADSVVSTTINANAGKVAAQSTEQARLAAEAELAKAAEAAKKAELAMLEVKGGTAEQRQKIEEHYNTVMLTAAQRAQNEEMKLASLAATEAQTRETNLRADMALGMRKDAAAAKEAEREAQAERDKSVAKAAASLHISGVVDEKTLKNLKDKKQQAAIELMRASDSEKLGANPYQVVDNWKWIRSYAQQGPDQAAEIKDEYPPDQQRMVAFLEAQLAKKKTELSADKTVKMTSAEMDKHANDLVEDQLRKMKANPEGEKVMFNGEAQNFYKAAPWKELLEHNLPGNRYNTAAAEAIGVSSGREVTPETVLTNMASKMLAKDPAKRANVTELATDTADFYQTMVDSHNENLKFNKFGYPVQDSYVVKVQGKPVDLLNPAQVTKALLGLQAKMRQEFQFGMSAPYMR